MFLLIFGGGNLVNNQTFVVQQIHGPLKSAALGSGGSLLFSWYNTWSWWPCITTFCTSDSDSKVGKLACPVNSRIDVYVGGGCCHCPGKQSSIDPSANFPCPWDTNESIAFSPPWPPLNNSFQYRVLPICQTWINPTLSAVQRDRPASLKNQGQWVTEGHTSY